MQKKTIKAEPARRYQKTITLHGVMDAEFDAKLECAYINVEVEALDDDVRKLLFQQLFPHCGDQVQKLLDTETLLKCLK